MKFMKFTLLLFMACLVSSLSFAGQMPEDYMSIYSIKGEAEKAPLVVGAKASSQLAGPASGWGNMADWDFSGYGKLVINLTFDPADEGNQFAIRFNVNADATNTNVKVAKFNLPTSGTEFSAEIEIDSFAVDGLFKVGGLILYNGATHWSFSYDSTTKATSMPVTVNYVALAPKVVEPVIDPNAKKIVIVYDAARIDVSTGINPDLALKPLFEAEGYTVWPMAVPVISTATPEQLDSLNNADLIYIGRAVASGNFSSPNKEIWNAVTAPILTGNMWGLRNSRGNWFNSGDAANVDTDDAAIFQANIAAISDPVFAGVSSPADWWMGSFSTIGAKDAGNGQVMATKADDGKVLFARFKAGVEFYTGTTDKPAGERVYFGSGSDNKKDAAGNNLFNYFGFTDPIKQVFFNEVARLTKKDAKSIVIVYDPARIDVNTGMNPDLALKPLFEAEGYIVNPMATPIISTATQEQLDSLNNADLIYIGRAVGSGNFSSPNKEIWNAITAPILTGNMWGLRNSRGNWFNNGNAANVDTDDAAVFQANITAISDPVFAGVSSPTDWWMGSFSTIGATDAGNGQVLATKADNGVVLFARFSADVEYYVGTTDKPAGERVYFGSGSDNKKDAAGNSMFNYFGFTDPIKKVFFNEVARLTGKVIEVVDPVKPTSKIEIANIVDGTITDEADYKCIANMRWDADSIYIAMEINDDVLYDGAANVWESDNIEIYFDMDNSKNPTWPRNAGWPATSYDANDFQLRILPGKTWEAYNTVVTNANLTTTMKDGGYDISVSIPWASLKADFVPTAGTQIGFDILASDNDNDSRNQVTWNAKTPMPWNDASLFGTLELLDGGIFKGIPDLVLPEKPVVTATANGSTVTLTWDNPVENVAVLYYDVKQDGVVINDKIYAAKDGNTYTIKNLADGTYKFSVNCYDNSGNRSKGDATATVKTTSVNDISAAFKVYPNPSNGVVNIATDSYSTSVLEVFNMTGERILRKSFTNNCTIDLSANQKGFYLLNVTTDNKPRTMKLEVK